MQRKAAIALLFLTLLTAPPLLGQPCSFEEIASAGLDQPMWPALSGYGTAVVFRSNHDLVPGSNTDGSWELFLWEASGFRQLTDTAPASQISIGPPSISNDGQSIAFSSSADLTGENNDSNFEIFLIHLPTALDQITSTVGTGPTGILNEGPVISGNGQVLAFSSAADLLGTNSDGSFEVFTWRPSAGFEQLTDTLINNGFPSVNLTGTAIAHLSVADLSPPANSDGSSEIFVHTPPTVAQITSTLPTEFVDHPRLSQESTRVVFTSNADLVAGANADHSIELFLFDQFTGFAQLTVAAGPGFTGLPAPDSGAKTIAFQSDRDLVPSQNSDGNSEIFVWRFATGIAQLTDTIPASHNTHPTTSLSGNLFAYELVTSAQRSVVLVDCRGQLTEVPTLDRSSRFVLGIALASLALIALRWRVA